MNEDFEAYIIAFNADGEELPRLEYDNYDDFIQEMEYLRADHIKYYSFMGYSVDF